MIVLAVWGAACGLDESGLLAGDASIDQQAIVDARADGDVVVKDNDVPPVCSTLDASCLGALPAGWEPFAMELDASAVACPGDAGDFATATYETSPVVSGNSCVCTPCTVGTAWDCSATVGVNGACNATTKAFGDTQACWTVSGTTGGGTIARTGTATCAPSTYFATTATATPVAGCAPTQCDVDFCGLGAKGFKLCARNASVTDGTCPPSLPVSHVVGANPHAACNACPTCTITNPTATCTATLSGYTSNNCTTGLVGSVSADGTCATNTSFNSVLYQPTVPIPMCSPTGPTNVGGTGALDAPLTICCTN
jgi:hypothetical protein